MKAFIFLSFYLLTKFGFETSLKPCYQKKENKMPDIILAKMNSMPEVRNFIIKNKKERAALMIAREPDLSFKYYWVKLGISNFDMFRTTINYYVYPINLKIYVVDVMDTSGWGLISLKQWRKLCADRRLFNRLHIIKAGKIIPVK